MPRPLMQHGVGQLEALFAKSKSDSKVLKQLEHELEHRQVPRALALLAEVQSAVKRAASFSNPVAGQTPDPAARALAVRQPELWERSLGPAMPVPPSTGQSREATPTPEPYERPVAAKVPLPSAPYVGQDDAYKLLKATPGSTWESIEQMRRQLVRLSHPARLMLLTAEMRAQTLAEAKRVNTAYFVLSQIRCGVR